MNWTFGLRIRFTLFQGIQGKKDFKEMRTGEHISGKPDRIDRGKEGGAAIFAHHSVTSGVPFKMH